MEAAQQEANPYDEVAKRIDGITYTARKWPTMLGLRIGAELCKLLADEDAIRLILVAFGDDESNLLGDRSVQAALMARAAKNISPESVDALRDTMHGMRGDLVRQPGVQKGLPGDVYEHFDSHFAGRYGHLMKVIGFAVGANWGGPTAGSP